MNIITASQGKVFKRIHDGFIFGNEIVLGIDYSTGVARQDLAEYYEEVLAFVPHTLPPPNAYYLEVLPEFLGVFKDNKFIFGEYEIPLYDINGKKCVNTAHFGWQQFRNDLDELMPDGTFRHKALKDVLMSLWDNLLLKYENQNFIVNENNSST